MPTGQLERVATVTPAGTLRVHDDGGGRCGFCADASGCSLLALRATPATGMSIVAPPGAAFTPGQTLRLRVSGAWLLSVAALVYGGLAVLLLLGAIAGAALLDATPDWGALAGGSVSLALGLLLLKLYDSRLGAGLWSRRVQMSCRPVADPSRE